MKPDWKDAPDWAQYLAMDRDGAWYWHETEPACLNDFWHTVWQSELAGGHENEWQYTLEGRP